MAIESQTLQSKLKLFFGFETFKPGQEEIIKHLIDGNDAFVLMPTGGGKSMCYQLPALLMEGTAIVISPLIALMKNQVDVIRGFVSEGEGIAHFLNSSLNKQQISEVRADLLSGTTKLLYVAPESLTKQENIALLKEIKISFYAIDEAHCISEWGHDFRPEYRRIKTLMEEIGKAPVIALTATATIKVQNDIMRNLGIPEARVFKSSFNRPNLYYEIRDKVNPVKDIVKYIKQRPGKSGIIYCLSRKKVEELSEILNINGIKARPYHAGLDAKTRAENQDAFLMEEVDVIVATIAFGMGIDKPDVRFVIHYDIPKSLEGYYQETGRAGRDGQGGECIAFYTVKDIQKLEKFMQGKPISEQEIGRELLMETLAYAESTRCRRRLLLKYFGEEYTVENCGACDNCLHPREFYDAREDLKLVIELISSLPENFKLNHLANILCGNSNAMIKSYKQDESKFFGIGKERGGFRFWCSVIYQALAYNFLYKDIEAYGLVYVSQQGKEFYEKPYQVLMNRERDFVGEAEEDDDEEIGMANRGGGGGDDQLLAMLKDLRKDMAKRLRLQPWIIFGDPALEDMSILYPITLKQLTSCQGVGEGKAQKYGAEFVKLIAKYVEENEIERPEDFVLKTAPSNSQNKVAIIQGIDRKMSLDDIALGKNIDIDELLSEIETIVASGTKLDLNYYIQETLDEEIVAEIYDYFKEEAESDSLEDAIKELGGDYEELEIRLVRLKFICEVAN